MICLNQWALFGGEMVDRNLKRDEQLPEYWLEAAAAMDSPEDPALDDTRVYEMPGTDFASYRWGNTVDPITPGLIDRPYAARELIPYGTPASADMLNAFDLPLQEGQFDPDTVAPLAQLLGVGTIAHRGDLQFERFRSPRPDIVYSRSCSPRRTRPHPSPSARRVANQAADDLPLDDEVALGVPPGTASSPGRVSLFDLQDPRPITAHRVGVIADAAGRRRQPASWHGPASERLDPDRPILYSGELRRGSRRARSISSPSRAPSSSSPTPTARQARRWGSVRENDGYTERAGEEPLETDPADNRLDEFPGAGDDAFTVSEQLGDATVSASAYGNPVSYTPADRAARAMDGDPATAWRVGAFDEPRGEYLQVDLDAPVTTDQLTLLQTQREANRWITEVELSFDDGDPITVGLDDVLPDSSDRADGHLRRADLLSACGSTITETNLSRRSPAMWACPTSASPRSAIPGVAPVTEVVRPPTDLLDAAGNESVDHPLTYVFTRRAANPAEIVVDDEEPWMPRWVRGTRGARLHGVRFGTLPRRSVSAQQADALLGCDPTMASRSSRVPPWPATFAPAPPPPIDGNPDTAWQTPINGSVGQMGRGAPSANRSPSTGSTSPCGATVCTRCRRSCR